ncbi:MAG: hypothetical protein RMJ55_12610 [Roseiflexaceae bacterium]|nr:hypothetical protein [Roseiflexaceae bacterium]
MAVVIENLDAARSALIDLLRREYYVEHDALVASIFDADGAAVRVLASGWGTIDGVLAYRPETHVAATTRALVVAVHERALRDLLSARRAAMCCCFWRLARGRCQRSPSCSTGARLCRARR